MADVLYLLDEKQQINFAKKIHHDPFSAMVHNCLLIHGRGFGYKNFAFYALTNDEQSHVVIWKYEGWSGMHCLPHEVTKLVASITTTKLFDCGQIVKYFHLLDDYVEIFKTISLQKTGIHYIEYPGHAFIHQPTSQAKPVADLVCPAGYRVYLLNEEGLRHLHQQYRYSSTIKWEDLLHMGMNTPFVGAYPDAHAQEHVVDLDILQEAPAGQLPTAWIGTAFWGGAGMLMTSPSHLRKGLGTLVSRVCGRLQYRQGYILNGIVEDYNEASRQMSTRMTGSPGTVRVTWLIHPDHDESTKDTTHLASNM